MGYKVFISTGKGKNYASTGSIELPTKERVSNYIKRNPLGNYKTKVSVYDTQSKKTKSGSKLHFYNPSRW